MDGEGAAANDEEVYSAIALDTMSAVIDALTNSEKSLLETEFKRVMSTPDVKKRIKEIVPYLYVGAFLSLSGREISQENITKVLSAVGISPNDGIETLLEKAALRTHLPYLYAYYFLLALGKESTEDEILNIVNSIGITADRERIKEVFSYLTSKEKMQEGS